MSYTYFCCIVFLQLPSLDLVPCKTFMRMERSEDEENITETTVMLEMEEAEDRGGEGARWTEADALRMPIAGADVMSCGGRPTF